MLQAWCTAPQVEGRCARFLRKCALGEVRWLLIVPHSAGMSFTILDSFSGLNEPGSADTVSAALADRNDPGTVCDSAPG